VDRFVISYADTPPSLNNPLSGYRGHWSIGHKTKKRWEEAIFVLLMQERMPRNTFDYIEASAVLRFPKDRGRDAENHSVVLTKALGDVLVQAAILPNDTPDHYRFAELTFEKGPKNTTITLKCRRAEEPDA
jgi:hypothetical protein